MGSHMNIGLNTWIGDNTYHNSVKLQWSPHREMDENTNEFGFNHGFDKFGHREKWNIIKIPHGDFNFFFSLEIWRVWRDFFQKIILY